MRTSLLAPFSLLLLVSAASADTITLSSGSTIDDVRIQSEYMDLVTYRESNKNKTVPTSDVVSITYSAKPELIDQADAAMAAGDWGNAIGDFEAYLAEHDEPERLFKWAREYALHKRLECFTYIGSPAQVAEAAGDVATYGPESRHVPAAHVTKADFLFLAGDEAGAKAALAPLKALIDTKGLGERWAIEHDLLGVLFDSATAGAARRAKLDALESRSKAGYPSLRGRIQVSIAESFLVEGDTKSAEPLFQAVTRATTVSDASLAAAWYGLGRCIYERANTKAEAGEDATAEFEEALLALLRVVVVYEVHRPYVPPAFYYAGRSFDALGDPQSTERAQKMYSKVISRFPESRWAREARSFRRR